MKTIVFIVGAGHSGSTLLAKALNAHSGIFSLSEISQFYDEMQNEKTHCGCGSLLRECVFWNDINLQIRKIIGYGIKDEPDLFRISRGLNKNRIIDKIIFKMELNAAVCFNFVTRHIQGRLNHIGLLFEVIREQTGKAVLVDSSKSARRAFLLGKYFKKQGYDIKIIHLVRDGRAVLYSYLKGYYKVKLKNPVNGRYEMKTFHSENKRKKEDIVRLWKRDNYQSLWYHKILNKKCYYFMRYEDFANQPAESLQHLMSFLDLPYEEEMLDLNRFINHMVSGNASRINAERILPPFNNWKNKLTNEQLSYFRMKGVKMNKKLGYLD